MAQASLDKYSVMGDVGVIALCVVIFILLTTSYVSRTRSFKIFMNIVASIVIAAAVNIVYHVMLAGGGPDLRTVIYVLRILYNALLLDVLFLFALYTTEISGMPRRKAKRVAIVSTTVMTVILLIDIIRSIFGHGFRIEDDGTIVNQTNIYFIGYIMLVLMIAGLISSIKNLVYKRILYGFYGTMALSVIIRFVQLIFRQSSLTTMSFIFPVIAMLYIMHSNPYNADLGAVDIRGMEDMVRSMYDRKEQFVFLALLLPEYNEEGAGKLPEEIQALIRKASVEYFRSSYLFQIGNGHVVLIFPSRLNQNYESQVEKLLKATEQQCTQSKKIYKVVVGRSMNEISRKNGYVNLISSVERAMPENSVRRIGQEDIARYNQDEYILHELADIYKRRNLNDPRVLAFCQPVFNLQTGLFDTAEALMRLDLPETGIIAPNQFIPLAEAHGYIHVLTEIILNKTCREVKRLSDEGFLIKRVSVNISVLELKEDHFCGDISRIIGVNNISGDKIALEITETSSEADFRVMKEKIEELRLQGIQFYLDDFGTGYSNMQRIMELPFDIIKFDRSLVISSREDERSERIVENLAHLFRDLDYSILYEGVGDEFDEKLCRNMSASYLQGFNYSIPVPIEQLRRFLKKTA
ncbi:MAG: EAL domain-containing protein [Clostridia bacterium]|nr:EAL domain-containing protein [Clostridia bacterium]